MWAAMIAVGRGAVAVLVVIVVVLAGCTGGSGTAAVTSTFDDGTDGWTIAGDAQDGQAEPDHVASGGNPGGHLEAADDVTGGVWHWNASGAYLGDKSGYSDGTLVFELTQSRTDDQFDSPDVILGSGDVRLGYDFGDESTHPETDWTRYEVPLSADGWTNLDSGEPATEEEFERVLSDLDRLWIRGEYREGSDTGGIDNVELSG